MHWPTRRSDGAAVRLGDVDDLLCGPVQQMDLVGEITAWRKKPKRPARQAVTSDSLPLLLLQA